VREPDGLLHCSSDMVGPLRHSQLRAAGAPTLASGLINDITLSTGTMWHRYVGQVLVDLGVPFMQEVSVTPWLPKGWSGTADWIFYSPEHEAFVLGDLKTQKGEGFRYLREGGAKTEHTHQLSAYWYALRDMGIPLVKGFGILYLPKNDTSDKQERIEPLIMECDPLPEDYLQELMESRWQATERYLNARRHSMRCTESCVQECYLDDTLAPVQEREQKVWWNSKQQVFDVKLHPHWSAAYCPYPNELCDCSEAGVTKIGHYSKDGDEWIYDPRDGYEDILPTVEPSEGDKTKRAKELNA
jgi:hypothetical protein